MKQLLTQLDACMQRAASRLDLAYAVLASWSVVVATAPAMGHAVNAKPDFVAIRTATDVRARHLQEPPP